MYKELIEQRLNEAKAARAALSKINGVIVEKHITLTADCISLIMPIYL